MQQPASTAKATPLPTTCTAPPESRVTPAKARATPPSQCRLGRCPAAIQSIKPATRGAVPMVTSVATATPVRSAATKNASWLTAAPSPPNTTQRMGSL